MVVRECYTAALNAGGHPSGSPNYRNEDCSCFNAAVEDLDGNTVEFIFRQPHGDGGCCGEAALESERGSVRAEEDAEDAAQDDTRSVAQAVHSQPSKQSRGKSSMQTALDLASTTSKSSRSDTPSQGAASTKSNFPTRTLVGTALGAAAGAALLYAMGRAERANAKEEADHFAYMDSKRRSRSETRKAPEESKSMPPPPPKSRSMARSAAPVAHPVPLSVRESRPVAHSVAPVAYPAPPSVRETRKFHRNFSTTESAFSTRRPVPNTTQAMRMLEATGNNEDADIQEALGRHNSLRAMPTRSRTQDDYVYAPASQAGRSEHQGESRFSTIPVETHEPLQYLLEGPKSTASRHGTSRPEPQARSASHSSRHRRVSHDDTQLRRNDSGVSVHSSSRSRHHHRERGSDAGRRSSAGTLKPSRRDSAQHEPLPSSSKAASKAPSLLIETAAYYPAAISLPASVASTRLPSHVGRTPAALPPIHHSEQSWEEFTAGEESDGLGDIKTVVPDDSISCIDLSKRRRRRTSRQVGESSESGRSHHGKHKSSRHSSRRSEASESTVKPMKRGLEKEAKIGERSIFGF